MRNGGEKTMSSSLLNCGALLLALVSSGCAMGAQDGELTEGADEASVS